MTGYPVGSAVLVRYPRTPAEKDGPRAEWGRLPCTVTGQCGPDEWAIELDIGGVCFRDASEIRLQDAAGGDEQ